MSGNALPDNTLVILAVAGLAVICLGMFLVLFVTVFRFTGRNFMSFLALLLRNSKDDDNQPSVIRSPKPDLRSMAESEDFDSALARQAVRDANEPQSVRHKYSPPSASDDRPFDDAAPRLGSRRTRRPIDRSGDTGDLFDGGVFDNGDLPDIDEELGI